MDKTKKILIALIILLQPFVDMLRMTNVVNFEILGISIVELINISLVLTLFVITVFTYKRPKEFLKYLIFVLLLGIYFILHYYNILQFNIAIYDKQNPSFFIEVYHIFIIFIIPLMLLFSILYSGITRKELVKILKAFIFIVCFLIVTLNVLKLSLQAYDDGHLIEYNIFDWFTYGGNNYKELTSKGLFYSGNQMSAILLMCLPLTIYFAYKDGKKMDFITLLLQILSMFMLGTKVASLGLILVFVVFFGIYLFNRFIIKKKVDSVLSIVVFSVLSFCFFFVSPLGIHFRGNDKVTNPGIAGDKDYTKIYNLDCDNTDILKVQLPFIEAFIDKNKEKLNIHDYILNAYLPKVDIQYWCQFLKRDNLKVTDYRKMKTDILHRIYERNSNSLDKWFGMGNTLNYIYTEQDYSYQFYLYGIVGIILLVGPYYVIVGYTIFKTLKNMKKLCSVRNLTLLICPLIGLGVAYFSGHVLEMTFSVLVISILSAILFVNLREEIDRK